MRDSTVTKETMPSKKRSWTERLEDDQGLPRVEEITGKLSKRWGAGTVCIPSPREIDGLMRSVPEGKLVTINELRAAIAERHGATIGCPITTGIFAWIAANAAEEQRNLGREDTTPYWRTLKSGGEINPKYPGGVEGQMKLLEAEGHIITRKGKKLLVSDYKTKLHKP